MQAAPRIAVIGAGLIGRRHAELVRRHARLSALVDPNEATKGLAEQHTTRWFATLEECLATDPPDGAIIATPNQLHVAHGRACLAAGVPVLVEKPIAETVAGGALLVDMADATATPLLVGHHRRHNPLITAAKDAIASGRLGEIVAVDARFWLFKPDDYFDPGWRRAPGAGPVFINLIHDIDLLRHLCGDIRRVQAAESRRLRGNDVEDAAALLLEFESGALGAVTVSDTTVAPWSWEFTARENPAYPEVETHCYAIGGSHASLSIPDLTLWRHPGQRSWWNPIVSERLAYAPANPLERQLDHFIDVIANGATPLVSGREGLETLRVVEAVKTAAATGAAQVLAPASSGA